MYKTRNSALEGSIVRVPAELIWCLYGLWICREVRFNSVQKSGGRTANCQCRMNRGWKAWHVLEREVEEPLSMHPREGRGLSAAITGMYQRTKERAATRALVAVY
jgi:hypothetical protein